MDSTRNAGNLSILRSSSSEIIADLPHRSIRFASHRCHGETLIICAAVVVLSFANSFVAGLQIQCDATTYTYEAVGCFKDSRRSRVLKTEILNFRDSSSAVYAGEKIDWANWNAFLQRMMCKCLEKAPENSMLGLQYFGECWSGELDSDYSQFGWTSRCISKDYKVCDDDDPVCVGKAERMFFYKKISA